MTADLTKIDAVICELLELHSTQPDMSRFKEPMLAMGSEGGRLVETVVRMIRPRLGLEIGTSSGFSALCAMRGALDSEFKLVTVDHDSDKAEWARENFRRAGVADRIEVVVDDGLAAARKLEGPFDFVLLDAAKSQNLPIIQSLLPKLNVGAVVLTDNAMTHATEMRDFFNFVRCHSELNSATFEVGNGIEMTIKLTDQINDQVNPDDFLF